MEGLLSLAKGMWDFIYTVFIVGLIKFDNPILSLFDYLALLSAIIGLITKGNKKLRNTRR